MCTPARVVLVDVEAARRRACVPVTSAAIDLSAASDEDGRNTCAEAVLATPLCPLSLSHSGSFASPHARTRPRAVVDRYRHYRPPKLAFAPRALSLRTARSRRLRSTRSG